MVVFGESSQNVGADGSAVNNSTANPKAVVWLDGERGALRRGAYNIITDRGGDAKQIHEQSFAASSTAFTKLDTSATPCQAMSNAVP